MRMFSFIKYLAYFVSFSAFLPVFAADCALLKKISTNLNSGALSF